jgi:hypothetical protein
MQKPPAVQLQLRFLPAAAVSTAKPAAAKPAAAAEPAAAHAEVRRRHESNRNARRRPLACKQIVHAPGTARGRGSAKAVLACCEAAHGSAASLPGASAPRVW